VRERGALEHQYVNAGLAEVRKDRHQLGVPHEVHDDRVTFGALKLVDEFLRPVGEGPCRSERPPQ